MLLPVGNIKNAFHVPLHGMDIGLDNILYKGKIPALFAIPIDERRLIVQDPGDEFRAGGELIHFEPSGPIHGKSTGANVSDDDIINRYK